MPSEGVSTSAVSGERTDALAQAEDSAQEAAGRDARPADAEDTRREAQREVQQRATQQAQEHPSAASPSSVRVRRRLARLGAQWGTTMNPVLEPLVRSLRGTHVKADVRSVERAYDLAAYYHSGQQRRSGDWYISHPLAVATILAELGMTPPTIVAALLHDVVEDTSYTLDSLRGDFGEEVASLVDGVTKLDKVKFGEAAEAETLRKMVVAMSRDIRVLVIKLADRLHNMRTVQYLPKEKQERTARQTLEIYAPLAHRLGMNALKWELEDLSFASLYPKRYDEIARLVSDRSPRRDVYLQKVIEEVSADLRAAKIRTTVSGRPKHYYSIYQKMIARDCDFANIYDLVGVRVLVDSVRDCYAALGTIHARWNPVPGRFKDYVAMPKFNMYQSLHTTVIGPEGKPVELQIRTWGMHRRAEYGIAAHWKYKEEEEQTGKPSAKQTAKGSGKRKHSENDLSWLRQLVDWQQETTDPGEFLESLRFDLGASEVFVFTPKGDVITLPQGATPVDFAYAVHTEVGHRCIGAKVGGRLVPLESTLDNGDVVEIFTSKAADAGPSRDWQTFVASARARNKIRQWFSKERRETAIEEGKNAISRTMRKQGLPLQRMASGEALVALARDLHYADVSALYAAIGEGHISAKTVVRKLVSSTGGVDSAQEDIDEGVRPTRQGSRQRPPADPGVVVKGMTDVWVRLSRCCTPVPGDEIVGFVTRGSGVSVHQDECPNLADLRKEPERFVEVSWDPSADSVFLVAIQVEALDRTRLLSDITRVLSESHVNILSASVTTTRDRVAMSRFSFEMGDTKHLGHVLKTVRTVEGVYDAYRVTSGSQ